MHVAYLKKLFSNKQYKSIWYFVIRLGISRTDRYEWISFIYTSTNATYAW